MMDKQERFHAPKRFHRPRPWRDRHPLYRSRRDGRLLTRRDRPGADERSGERQYRVLSDLPVIPLCSPCSGMISKVQGTRGLVLSLRPPVRARHSTHWLLACPGKSRMRSSRGTRRWRGNTMSRRSLGLAGTGYLPRIRTATPLNSSLRNRDMTALSVKVTNGRVFCRSCPAMKVSSDPNSLIRLGRSEG